MTAVERGGTGAGPATEISSLAADVSSGLLAALCWGAVTAFRYQGAITPALLLVAVGAPALSTVPASVLLRRALPLSRGLAPGIVGVLLVSAPLALLGAVLSSKTNHRALGGVVFAIVALGAWALGSALAARLGRNVRSRFGWVPSVIAAVSLLVVVRELFTRSGLPLGDGLVGFTALALATLVPRFHAPPWATVAAFVAWVGLVGVGARAFRVGLENADRFVETAPVSVVWLASDRVQ